MIYVCPACGAGLVLSGSQTTTALARIIDAHEQSDYHIAATGAAAPAERS